MQTSTEFSLSFPHFIVISLKTCNTQTTEWISIAWGWQELGWNPNPASGPRGLVVGLLNALNSFQVFSLSWFKCCCVLQEDGGMMCLYFYCRKMDLVMWGHWGNSPQLLRGRRADGKYSGRKAVCIIKQWKHLWAFILFPDTVSCLMLEWLIWSLS